MRRVAMRADVSNDLRQLTFGRRCVSIQRDHFKYRVDIVGVLVRTVKAQHGALGSAGC